MLLRQQNQDTVVLIQLFDNNEVQEVATIADLETKARMWHTPHSLKSSNRPNRWCTMAVLVAIPPASAMISFNTTTQLATT